jgi:hypothetical protein
MIKKDLMKYLKQGAKFLFVMLLFIINSNVAAADTESELKFYINPILPSSQLDGGASDYFDLNIEAGQSDVLALEVQNSSNETITIDISVHTAFTNVNGIVEYGKDAEDPDPTLPAMIDKLVTPAGEITLDPKEKKVVEMPIAMPEESFEGVLAGGIRVQEIANENDAGNDTQGVAIKNAFSYVIGIVISNNRTSVSPDIELMDVFPDQVNYRNVFSATIQNFTSTFVNKLEVEASIREEGSDEILYETEQTNMQMAPNSHFHFPIPLNGERFRSGTYVLNMTARSGEEEWEWTQTFEVESDKAASLNRADVTIDSSINWWMVGTITLFMIIILFIVIFLVMKKNKEVKAGKKTEF